MLRFLVLCDGLQSNGMGIMGVFKNDGHVGPEVDFLPK